jgi:hypothetical protein
VTFFIDLIFQKLFIFLFFQNKMTYYGVDSRWFWFVAIVLIAVIITVLILVGRSGDKSIYKSKDNKETSEYEEF